jgi:hypothetical protein
VSVKFARELEIELSAVRKELEEAKSSADTVCDSYAAENQRLHDRALAAETALAAAQKDAEQIRDHLRVVLPMAKAYAFHNNVGNNVAMVDEAIRALSAQKDGDTDA